MGNLVCFIGGFLIGLVVGGLFIILLEAFLEV